MPKPPLVSRPLTDLNRKVKAIGVVALAVLGVTLVLALVGPLVAPGNPTVAEVTSLLVKALGGLLTALVTGYSVKEREQ